MEDAQKQPLYALAIKSKLADWYWLQNRSEKNTGDYANFAWICLYYTNKTKASKFLD
jgi:hypothetical protein